MFQFIKKAAVMMVIVMGCMFTAEAQCIHKAGIQARSDSCMQSLDKDPFSPSMKMEAERLTGELYEPFPICDGSMRNHISSYSGKSFISQWFDVALIVAGCSAYFLLMLMLFVRDKNKKAGKPTDFASVLADSLKVITDFFMNIGRKIKSKYSSETPTAEQQDKKEEGEK